MVEGCGRIIPSNEPYWWKDEIGKWIKCEKNSFRECTGEGSKKDHYNGGKGRLCKDCWIRLGHIW